MSHTTTNFKKNFVITLILRPIKLSSTWYLLDAEFKTIKQMLFDKNYLLLNLEGFTNKMSGSFIDNNSINKDYGTVFCATLLSGLNSQYRLSKKQVKRIGARCVWATFSLNKKVVKLATKDVLYVPYYASQSAYIQVLQDTCLL